jgi:general secretion pathway protein L
MKALFFIEIPTQPHTEELSYHWYKKELNNDSYGCNGLAEIKTLSLESDVILILPGFNVTHKKITSKIRNRKKLELAIAYQLEEVLSEEIETLFFAYQPTKDKNSLDVAIVNREWFEKWLEVFKQQEILLSAVISDLTLLELMPQDYLLIEKFGYFLLKTPDSCYTIDTENLVYFLTQLKESLPEELFLISDKEQPVLPAEIELTIKNIPVKNGLLALLTENYQLESGINLLQGSYKPKLKNDWQKIKWVTVGLLALLLIASSFQWYQHWQLTKQEAKLDQQRVKIFQDNFPAIKRVVNPLVQMKSELEKLKQSQQQQGQFISLLAKVAIALRELIAAQAIHLLGLEFDNNVLTVKLNAGSLALIEQIKQSLIQQQLNVEMESPEKVDNQVNASFKIVGKAE